MEYRLNFELVPDGCWYSNLRSILSTQQWDVVRHIAYARANGRCVVCDRAVARLEAHERWAYNEETHTQILTDIIAVCRQCHAVIHIGRTQLTGGEEQAAEWFMKVNHCTYAEYRAALGKANEEHIRRNRVPEWKTDISYLAEFLKKKQSDS